MLVFATAQAILLFICIALIYLARSPLLPFFIGLSLFLPMMSVTARRLHDVGRTGWYVLPWSALPILAMMFYITVTLVTESSTWGGDNPSQVRSYMALGFAVTVTIAVVAWVAWWLRAPSNGPNQYDTRP